MTVLYRRTLLIASHFPSHLHIHLQLKDMREAQFGKLSQLVPPADTSRHPYIPLPDSTAQPYGDGGFVDLPLEQQHWECASSQKLEGKMLPLQKEVTVKDVLFVM